MARSPSGKAEDCKSSIVGSIPTRASISFFKKIPMNSIRRDFLSIKTPVIRAKLLWWALEAPMAYKK